ncbi:DUF6292 family protein [Actinoplanes sp. NPDC020271]|uniref:DUF6292 family protein n=1 Tax=Actinoplanes sp. NPDC020271 TaxID=3363896 RepID=UPI00379E7881
MTTWNLLRAVAEALEAAGVAVADWRADNDEGWIPFDRARPSVVTWDHDQAGLGWSRTGGWYLLLITSPGRRVSHPLPVPAGAEPSAVVAAVLDFRQTEVAHNGVDEVPTRAQGRGKDTRLESP